MNHANHTTGDKVSSNLKLSKVRHWISTIVFMIMRSWIRVWMKSMMKLMKGKRRMLQLWYGIHAKMNLRNNFWKRDTVMRNFLMRSKKYLHKIHAGWSIHKNILKLRIWIILRFYLTQYLTKKCKPWIWEGGEILCPIPRVKKGISI